MPAGRPPKYETPEELVPWELSPQVEMNDVFGFDDFTNEEELCDYIENHVKEFSRDILEETYVDHEREWDLNQYRVFGSRPKRIDFMFKTKESRCVLVECKNPTSEYAELRNGVSQLMSYAITCEENNIVPDRSVLVTSKYHNVIGKMIGKYKLPIEVFVLGVDKQMKLKQYTN